MSHPSRLIVVLLHGWAMRPDDLAPFTESLGVPATYVVPPGPVAVPGGGRAWWSVDEERRTAALSDGPRDLAMEDPPGRDAACAWLADRVTEHQARQPQARLVLAGFSQGGMLACDAVLRGALRPQALAVFSSSCIALPDWRPRMSAMAGLPVLLSHGRKDSDLSFAAGERLRDELTAAGARVRWLPFDGGHVIPLPVWRAFRQLLRETAAAPA